MKLTEMANAPIDVYLIDGSLFIDSILQGVCSLFRLVCSCQLDSEHQLHHRIQANRSHSILIDTLYQKTLPVGKT